MSDAVAGVVYAYPMPRESRRVAALALKVGELTVEMALLRQAVSRHDHEVEQTLGKALGYPALFPDASPVDDGTVGVGPHVPATLALEAAERIRKLEGLLAERTEGAA